MNVYRLVLKILFPYAVVLFCSCSALKNSPKYGFTEGYYVNRAFPKAERKVYVVPTADTIKVYTAQSLQKAVVDTTKILKIAFPQSERPANFESYLFRKNSFDLDILTIPFKYRPAVDGFPRQLNATFNGAFFLGYRSDLYSLNYKQSPIRVARRDVT